MPSLDYTIYGMDDNDFASSIASDALGAPSSNRKSGAPLDQSARSKGNTNASESGGDYDAKLTSRGTGNDKRACPAGNHGKQGCNE